VLGADGQRQQRLAAHLARHDVDATLDVVHVPQDVVRNHFRPADVVAFVHQHWRQHLNHTVIQQVARHVSSGFPRSVMPRQAIDRLIEV